MSYFKKKFLSSFQDKENVLEFDTDEDRLEWEKEQKRLDREWYNMDEGYDDDSNPFSGSSDTYMKKKEAEIEQQKKKRMSAQQRQINKVWAFSLYFFPKDIFLTNEFVWWVHSFLSSLHVSFLKKTVYTRLVFCCRKFW